MLIDTILQKNPIEKGWSGDRKYCVVTADGTKYLLRVASADRLERRKSAFSQMEKCAALGIPMPKPLEFGTCEEGVYTLETFIEGTDAEDYIRPLSPARQYALGIDAGRILDKLHTLPAPADAIPWDVRFNAKIDRKIAMYQSCELQYDNSEPFLTYIAENRHLLSSRPQSFQHGDYHIGNMMIDTAGNLVIIDFDREDWGDPWEEFNRIVWCAQAAPAFASGMVDGYFGGKVPMDFWRLLALYICSNTLSSLPWAIPFGETEIRTMRKQAAEVLLWYKNMTDPVPTWYQKPYSPEIDLNAPYPQKTDL